MHTYQVRSEVTFIYVFVAFTVLGNLAFAAWGVLSEVTAGPAHDDDMFAGIGYFVAALWGIPAALAVLILTAGRLATRKHETRFGLAVLAFAVNFAPWAFLIALH